MRKVLYVLTGSVVFLLILSLWGLYLAMRPLKIETRGTPADLGVRAENVSFKTADNIVIRGWFIPSVRPTKKTILLLHGYPADKGNILPSRLFLHSDYNLLFIDFRHLGESDGAYSTLGKFETLDVLAAIHYLQERGIDKIGVWGISMGAATALMAAPQAPQIRALVLEEPYARLDWLTYDYYAIPVLNRILGEMMRMWAWIGFQFDIKDVSPVAAAQKLTIPMLFIFSKTDTVIPYKHALIMQEALKNNSRVQFILLDDEPHSRSRPEDRAAIKKFFDTNLK